MKRSFWIYSIFACLFITGVISGGWWEDAKKAAQKMEQRFERGVKKVWGELKKEAQELRERVFEPAYKEFAKSTVGKALSGVGQNISQWFKGAEKEALDRFNKLVLSQLRNVLNKDNPYKNKVATVRMSSDLPGEEKGFVQTRMQQVVIPSLRRFLDDSKITEADAPRIAFCGSGGGFRAMIFTLGSLKGAQEIGLLSCAVYAAGLSGSTWCLAPLTAGNITLDDLKNRYIKPRITAGLKVVITGDQAKKIHQNYVRKILFGQPLSAVDFYAAEIADTLLHMFGQKRQNVYLSQKKVNPAKYPFPIYTAIRPVGAKVDKIRDYEWWEVTPFEVGYKGTYVPTWGFGRSFKDGSSTDFGPEQTLGMFMGVFGSAFEVAIKDVGPQMVKEVQKIKQEVEISTDFLPQDLKKFVPAKIKIDLAAFVTKPLEKFMKEFRLGPAKFKSFVPGIKDDIVLIDAGIAFNLPVPPLLRKVRNVDVIFIIDGSATIRNAPELKLAEQYARSYGLSFPRIDYGKAEASLISVHDDNRPGVPVVIYYKRGNNPEYKTSGGGSFDVESCVRGGACNTFNFKYSHADVDNLSGLAEFTVKQHKDLIRQALKAVVARKRGKTEKK